MKPPSYRKKLPGQTTNLTYSEQQRAAYLCGWKYGTLGQSTMPSFLNPELERAATLGYNEGHACRVNMLRRLHDLYRAGTLSTAAKERTNRTRRKHAKST